MIRKPFKTPFLKRPADSSEPPSKKPRLDPPTTNNSRAVSPVRKPLDRISSSAGNAAISSSPANGQSKPEVYFMVLWRKFTNKKHKTWDGDGILAVRNGYATLVDISGKEMGRSACKVDLEPGSSLSVAGKEIEVDSVIPKAEYLSGKHFLSGSFPKPVSRQEVFKKPTKDLPEISKPVVAVSKASVSKYKNPYSDRPKPVPTTAKPEPTPRHDPKAPDAIVMKRPASAPRGKQIVDVVIDPILGRHLREHQREGVKFLYECVMGMRVDSGQGAVLADEMGLGKTLQTITLIWTLLKQNPLYQVGPVVKKVLIVCPVTLINNWRKEFRKWLGNDRIGVFVLDDKGNKLSDFTMGMSYNVMIVGYEKLRSIQDELKKGSGVDLIIADEAHRLKTAKNKAALAIGSFDTDRRVLLTGTPLQNDLGEFFYMADLVNPGILGKYSAFKSQFENVIVKGREPGAVAKAVEKGQARSEELESITSQFLLRRTADVIAKYLPPKTELVLFCRPTEVQAAIYRLILDSPVYGSILSSSEASLQLISILKKVCNSPSLFSNENAVSTPSEAIASVLQAIPTDYFKWDPRASAKMQLLKTLLDHLRQETDEKIVIVSNYTSTLDLIQRLLTASSYGFLRLDGNTAQAKRQGLVDNFNKSKVEKCFAFLLSAKAGGMGLNLIGASRLVLFDIDWNPATDQQAMARIHRDGQKKQCFIYRFIVQGAIEEKIYQRQVTKTSLADAVVDSKKTAHGFTTEELRDLFRLDDNPKCPTHELLGCDCEGLGNAQVLPENEPDDGILSNATWRASEASSPDEDSGSDSDVPQLRAFTNANKVDIQAQEKKIRKINRKAQGDKKMLALMQNLHIDADEIKKGNEELDALVEDRILLDMIKEPNCPVSFFFSKTTG
ncbi:hypothetical protein BT63DRAFT_407326 [Microthyrium microscopicum]|uniref:DNA repair and recombination protein RAD26 n=1 Tax=Microthyrium microscopicum TaxID=703497 RepID=A0A6A6TY14_9PEZI|nr:hypothetical protein BT63DRAFT_407326 [Microthyrium microscopicum]